MNQEQIARILERIVLLLELQGVNVFRIRSYKKAAEILSNFSGDLERIVEKNDWSSLSEIGDSIRNIVTELVVRGESSFYEKLKSQFPTSLFELFSLRGLGSKKIKILYESCGIQSVEQLKQACEKGEVSKVKGFGIKTEKSILQAILFDEAHAHLFRMGEVAPLVETFLEYIKGSESIFRADCVGSYRRSKEVVANIDFLVATRTPEDVSEHFIHFTEVEQILSKNTKRVEVKLTNGIEARLSIVTPEEYALSLYMLTGSKKHQQKMQEYSRTKGWDLSEEGLIRIGHGLEKKVTLDEESDLYKTLDLAYIPATLREEDKVVDIAQQNKIPKLIELENIRGVFHNHTVASDGQNSVEEMAEAAMDLGLEYLGIADHSKSSFQANGLYPDRLLKQKAEIDALNKKWGGQFRIFSGSEVDILKDGSLDFDNSILKQLDYVVASVHQSFTLPEEEMTRRIIKAMENPYVTMIGHLTGRLLLRRPSYAVNIDKIINCAVETGTILELNSNPHRLDMDWRHWQKARDKGVLCSINPDAHHTSHLQFIAYGVRIAQKGWLSKNDVINTKPLSEMESFLNQK